MAFVSKCFHIKNDRDEDFDAAWQEKVLTNKHFECRLYYKNEDVTLMVARSAFTFTSESSVEILGLYNENKATDLLPQKLIKGIGKQILLETLHKAKKRGAKIATLIPLDDGSGKLFRYYYNLGFRCVDGDLDIGFTETLHNDFVSNSTDEKTLLDKTFENYAKCGLMKLDLSLLDRPYKSYRVKKRFSKRKIKKTLKLKRKRGKPIKS